ncbi:glycosyltransferase [Ruegeria sp. HKCCA4633]|uniref:glycosyltransferase n=1 Tax=Ruegeria sp. HKCCA4633 TaxID=2682983 RepID=UPI00148829FB|nr:glycosyltransferase [Ruegeria sp. HKCCA4633]
MENIKWAIRHPRKAAITVFYDRHAFVAKHQAAGQTIQKTANDTSRRADAPIGRHLREGITITGYLRSEIGLGQAARNLSYAADRAQLPISMRHLPIPGRENEPEFATKCNDTARRRGNLFVLGLPAISTNHTELQTGQSNILYPFWELPSIPKDLFQYLEAYDEVWAPSRFIASAFDDRPGIRVRFLPVPVRVPSMIPPTRLNRTKFRIFTFFDFDSFGARKNPQASVAAFQAAFSRDKDDVELTIKTRGENDKGLRKWLNEVAANDNRIKIIDQTFSRKEVDNLIINCDTFISMHRSEGFGFGAAEALAAGKAVIATDYGGTTDFINENTGYPVPYDLIPLKTRDYIHSMGQSWADPSIEAASIALRAAYDSPDSARKKAVNGFNLLNKEFSTTAVGEKMKFLMKTAGLANKP